MGEKEATESTTTEETRRPHGKPPQRDAPASAKLPLEQWATQHKIADWEVARVKLLQRWPIGREVTEQEFLAAVNAARNVQIR